MQKQKPEALIKKIKIFLHTTYWLTPLNLIGERDSFLKSRVENPSFVYPTFPKEDINHYLNELSNISNLDGSEMVVYILGRQVEELKLKLKLIIERDTEEFSTISQKLYQCRFQETVLFSAKKDASIEGVFESKETMTPEEIVEKMKVYLAHYDIKDWKVFLADETDFYIRIKATQKTVFVSKRFNWDFCDIDNTLAHEIDGHVLRSINAQKQNEPLLQKPLPFYIKTEEGLASFLGDYLSTTADISRKHHALKYLAGNLALTSSFREVYKFLVNSGFTPDLAFQRTFRLKRGFCDTSKPGLYAKEAVYYEGMIEVKKYLDDGGDVRKLYAGKFGLEDLDLVAKDIPEDIIVPDRLKLSSYVES